MLGYGNIIDKDSIREIPRFLDFKIDAIESKNQFYASKKPVSDLKYMPDLGSGIFLKDAGSWRILGMVESNTEPRNDDSTSFLFTNVRAYQDWIKTTSRSVESSDMF